MPKLPPNFSIQKAHQTQLCLSKSVIREDRLPKPICTVGGVDVAYIGEMGIGATVVLDYNSLKVIETSIAICPVKMPYVPSLLSFRELPFAMAAIKKLKCQRMCFWWIHRVTLIRLGVGLQAIWGWY
jgi:deoxyribonuclease V